MGSGKRGGKGGKGVSRLEGGKVRLFASEQAGRDQILFSSRFGLHGGVFELSSSLLFFFLVRYLVYGVRRSASMSST